MLLIFEAESHPNATQVRRWVVTHSPEYYELLIEATERSEEERKASSDYEQFDQCSLNPNATDNETSISATDPAAESFSKESIIGMMLKTQQIRESAPIAEYDYVSSDVTDILVTALTSKTASGKPRYKHGQLSASLFVGTIMLGLRPREWQHASFIEMYSDPFSSVELGPVLEVHTLKQEKRRDDNPLRESRLIVLDKFRKSEVEFVRGLVAAVHSRDGAMDKMLNNVRMTLTNVWKRLVKEGKVTQTNKIKKSGRASSAVGAKGDSGGYGVNLYTARHVFAEEVKRSGQYTRFELAAMIGHTTTVNQRYYTLGNRYKLKTYSHTLPRPWPGDAEDIELWCDDVLKQFSASDIKRLRGEGVSYASSNENQGDSIEDFFNR